MSMTSWCCRALVAGPGLKSSQHTSNFVFEICTILESTSFSVIDVFVLKAAIPGLTLDFVKLFFSQNSLFK